MEDYIKTLLTNTFRLKERFAELGALIAAPEIIADNRLYLRLVLEHSGIEEAAKLRAELEACVCEAEGLRTAIEESHSAEYKKLLVAEIDKLEAEAEALAEKLRDALKPAEAEGSILLELKASDNGASSEFCRRLVDFYISSVQINGWHIEEKSLNGTPSKIKSASYLITGFGVYNAIRRETGIHRLEEAGKTASVIVAILKFAPYTHTDIDEKDIRIDIFHSGGAGGQNINKVETAVRITHIPTGIAVTCQDERSQLKNRDKAKKTLEERLDGYYKKLADDELKHERKEMFAAAQRNDRMRIYDFLSGKITDCRTGVSITVNEAEQGKLLMLTENCF